MTQRPTPKLKPASRKGAEEARKHFPSLLERAARGEPTVITKHGRAYAALVPVSALPSTAGGADFLALRGSGKGLWGRSVRRAIARMRDEWR